MQERYKSAASVALALTGFAVFTYLFLEIEQQWAVAALAIGAMVALLVAGRSGIAARVERSAAANQRAAVTLTLLTMLIVAAALHESHFALLMLATVALYVIACLGLTIQFGYAGIVNFAGAAFFGIGCYTTAVLAAHTPLPHVAVIGVSGLLSALIGSALILPILRTRGHYAALITIAFGILFKTFLEVNDTLGGPQGLKVPGMTLFGWSFNDPIRISEDLEASFYLNYVALASALAAFAFVMVKRLERSWIGLNFDAVRLDETAAAVFGIAVARWKILAFTLGNFLAGAAGALYAMMTGFIAPNSFTFGDSLILVSIVILCGLVNSVGVIPAALLLLVLPEKLQVIQEYRVLLYAVLVILILLYRPNGLMPRRLRNYFPKRSQA
ncbi:MAG: branched-chain amino acid ABC transporter permease [Betaproteobacteria bacterium]